MVQRERTTPRGVVILGVLFGPRTAHRTEVCSMDQLIPSLATLVESFRDCGSWAQISSDLDSQDRPQNGFGRLLHVI